MTAPTTSAERPAIEEMLARRLIANGCDGDHPDGTCEDHLSMGDWCLPCLADAVLRDRAESREHPALAVLRRVEWGARDEYGYNYCPECHIRDVAGHAPDCALDAALRGAGEAMQDEAERLRAAASDAADRMDRARSILADSGNWGMLNTTELRAALRSAPAGSTASEAGDASTARSAWEIVEGAAMAQAHRIVEYDEGGYLGAARVDAAEIRWALEQVRRALRDVAAGSPPVEGEAPCGCFACRDARDAHLPYSERTARSIMIVCPDCRSKRCPKAADHRHDCMHRHDYAAAAPVPAREGEDGAALIAAERALQALASQTRLVTGATLNDEHWARIVHARDALALLRAARLRGDAERSE